MNILFLTMNVFTDIEMHNIYSDLMKEFIRRGHRPYIVTPREKKTGEKTQLKDFGGYCILTVKIGNTSGVSLIEKGLSTIGIERRFSAAVRKYLADVKFDLVLYSTPPITLSKTIKRAKNKNKAVSYLMLKDIFPQNAVDLGMFSKKSPIYKFFRAKEKQLYAMSDYIGCMSQANVDYVLKNNPEIPAEKVEICPNSIEAESIEAAAEVKSALRRKYGVPEDKTVFVYGGNLGKPQGIDFVIECLRAQAENDKAFFVIVGSGTEFAKLDSYYKTSNQKNLKVMPSLPKEDYDAFVAACDVGMIFLDFRFTIPNFPSRLLPYMQAKMPVLAVTDENTDVGRVIEQGGFGWRCSSNNVKEFGKQIDIICKCSARRIYGEKAFAYLKNNFSVEKTYSAVIKHMNTGEKHT